jgi:uncharacterized DUF497 family protein
MNFDWDEEKNLVNIRKHGLDFFDAWEMFEAPILEAVDSRFDYGETRFVAIGFLRNIVVVAVYTRRINDTIRIISLRKARKDERQKFFKYLKDQLGTPLDDE